MIEGLLQADGNFPSGLPMDRAFFDRLEAMAQWCYALEHAVAKGADFGLEAGVLTLDVDEPEPSFAGVMGFFPVTVTKDGGADGDSATAATWTYTIKSLAGATLGTGMLQQKPVPFGKRTYQAGSTGIGVAFYAADGTAKLWDAGEIETVGACTPATGGTGEVSL
jgi:hypothetical protein